MTELVERKREEDWTKEMERELAEIRNLRLKQTEEEEKENERKCREELKEGIRNYLESEEEIRKRRKERERVENEMRRIYREVAETLERKRKAKEKVRDSKLKIRNLLLFEKLSQQLEDKLKETDEKIRAEAREEEEKKQEEVRNMLKRREELRRERIEDSVKSEEQSKKKRDEVKLLQEREASERVDRQRCDGVWNEGERRKDWERKMRVRLELRRQRESDEERKKEEEYWRKAFLGDVEKEREDVEDYCQYVLEKAKGKKRPLFPILSAVKDVKLECGILRPRKNIDHLKSKIPIDAEETPKNQN